MNKKGLVLLSGGLDSVLACKLLLEQGLEIEAVNFSTCFCTCTKKGCKSEAVKVSENLGIKLKIINVTRDYLGLIRDPKHGYGRNMNPCIDCRIFMFKKAKSYMEEISASFIATGEVLGERPMSQRLDAMRLIEKESGLKGLIVRPLCARLMEPTLPEKEGIVDREKLHEISGRSRKPQMSLAAKYNITDYPCPAGGCLLTEPGFSRKLKDLIAHEAFSLENVRLLKVGRHFRLAPDLKFIVGRDENENKRLMNMAADGDTLFDVEDCPSPIGLMRGGDGANGALKVSAGIIARYSDLKEKEATVVYWKRPQDTRSRLTALPGTEETLDKLRI